MRYVFIFSLMLLFSNSAGAEGIKMASKSAFTKPTNAVHEFLESECSRESGKGCQHLGMFHTEIGEKQKAKLAFRRACELGRTEACSLAN